MIPKINIYYSYIYDQAVHVLSGKKYNKKCVDGGRKFVCRLKGNSAKILPKALKAYEEVSGLRWKDPCIEVFAVHGIPWDFSWPVTIKVRENEEDAVETLIHELGHLLTFRNEERIRCNNRISIEYRKENQTVKDHILLHAMLWKLYTKLFGEHELHNMIIGYEKWKDHYRAWQIVKKEGADNIIAAYVR